MAASRDSEGNGRGEPQGEQPRSADEIRIQRQTERIREMERLMRAAAAFARGKPGR